MGTELGGTLGLEGRDVEVRRREALPLEVVGLESVQEAEDPADLDEEVDLPPPGQLGGGRRVGREVGLEEEVLERPRQAARGLVQQEVDREQRWVLPAGRLPVDDADRTAVEEHVVR